MSPYRLPSLLLIAAFALAGCDAKGQDEIPSVRPVLTIIARASAAAGATFAGTVEARTSAVIGFRTLGRIVTRRVDTGDAVKTGDVLATLENTSLALAVTIAETDLSNALARQANARDAEDRQRRLARVDAASQERLESTEQARKSADSEVESARATLEKVKEQLGYATLTADFAGVVTATHAEVGQTVLEGDPVVTLSQLGARDAVVDIPDQLAEDLSGGAVFRVTLQSNPTASITGTVREVAPEADATTRTRRVKIALLDPPSAFRLGTTVTVALGNQNAVADIALPVSALIEANEQTQVWVVDPIAGTVSPRTVSVASRGQDQVRVSAGLSPGERIVVAGVNEIEPGQIVRVLDMTGG